MLQQDRVNVLRQTHSLVTTLMPIITAGLTVTGAVIATMEARRVSSVQPAEDPNAPATSTGATPATVPLARARRAHGSPMRRYVTTLVARLLMVVLGGAIVLALTVAATSTGRVGQAIIVTALILLCLYLVEKVAR